MDFGNDVLSRAFRVSSLGHAAQGARVWSLGPTKQVSGFRVEGLGFIV
jgi:hypothetical protein